MYTYTYGNIIWNIRGSSQHRDDHNNHETNGAIVFLRCFRGNKRSHVLWEAPAAFAAVRFSAWIVRLKWFVGGISASMSHLGANKLNNGPACPPIGAPNGDWPSPFVRPENGDSFSGVQICDMTICVGDIQSFLPPHHLIPTAIAIRNLWLPGRHQTGHLWRSWRVSKTHWKISVTICSIMLGVHGDPSGEWWE